MSSPTSVASQVPWGKLCQLLDKVKGASKKAMRGELLKNFMESYRTNLAQHRQLYPTADDSFYPCLRVLLPALDKDRGSYGVREKRLADLYIKVLAINKDAPDALKLINYRKPKTAGASIAGDFAEVAYYVLKNRCPAEGTLSLGEVDQHLDSIAANHAGKQHDAVTSTLLTLLRAMTATEQKWLIRVLLKDMGLGMGQAAILGAWHPDAKDYYDVNNNLYKVCTTLRDPLVRLHEIDVSLFAPFRPMLAERAVLEKVESQMNNKSYVAENKFDGERSQIHKKGNQYMYFSRNGIDFTANFGGSPHTGLLTPHLHPLIRPHVEEVILDGEVVCWHKEHNVVVTKGENYDVKNLRWDGPLQVCFCAFDILLLNGRVLSNLPLTDRRELLKTVLTETTGRVLISQQTMVHNKEDVVTALNAAIDRREEGLVIKDPDSVYKPAARAKGWIKVKPDYVESLVPELDLVIIGGYYGAGRQHGNISHFLMGVAEGVSDGGRVSSVASVCRVGSGYTDAELSAITRALTPLNTRPASVVQHAKDKPHVWYSPDRSVVLQIRAAEVSVSKSYGSGMTLRFPRVDTARNDKSWQDILTTRQLMEFKEEASGKLALQHCPVTDVVPKAAGGGRVAAARTLPRHFTPADLSTVTQTCSVLIGREICVLESGGGCTKQELEKIVAAAGGTITQNPGSQTYCVISSQLTVRSRNLKALHNIINPRWVLACVRKGELLPWGPLDAVSLLPQHAHTDTHDQYGDTYMHDVDQEELRDIVDNMEDVTATDAELMELTEQLREHDELYGLFVRVTAVMVDETGAPNLSPSRDLTGLQLQLYGGVVRQAMSNDVTHLICCRDTCSIPWSQRANKHLVTEAWVTDAIERGSRLDEKQYAPATPPLML